MPDLTTDVRYVKGIGEQRAKAPPSAASAGAWSW